MAPKPKPRPSKNDSHPPASAKSSTKTKKKAPLIPTPASTVPTPNWPPLRPLLPPSDLSLHTLHPAQILTIPHFFPSALAATLRSFLATLPLTPTPGKPKRGDAVRVNDRYQVEDAGFAARLWEETALRSLVEAESKELWGGEVLGLNANVRIYRYGAGMFFDRHYDDSNTLLFPSSTSPTTVPGKTTWTLLLYLSSPATGCEGGETVFYPDPPSKREAAPPPIIANLEVGTALLHRHGRDCLLHEGREVTAGEKWVIRSDLVVKR